MHFAKFIRDKLSVSIFGTCHNSRMHVVRVCHIFQVSNCSWRHFALFRYRRFANTWAEWPLSTVYQCIIFFKHETYETYTKYVCFMICGTVHEYMLQNVLLLLFRRLWWSEDAAVTLEILVMRAPWHQFLIWRGAAIGPIMRIMSWSCESCPRMPHV